MAPETEALAPSKVLLPPEEMDSRARQVEIMDIRRQVMAGGEVKPEILRRGQLLIRADRKERTRRSGPSNGRKKAKKEQKVLGLDDFLT